MKERENPPVQPNSQKTEDRTKVYYGFFDGTVYMPQPQKNKWTVVNQNNVVLGIMYGKPNGR